MPVVEEKKILKALLQRVDNAPAGFVAGRRSLLLTWLSLVVVSAGIFAVSKHIPAGVSAILFVVLGVVYSQLYFRIAYARGWAVVRHHLNRQSIVDRLSEL